MWPAIVGDINKQSLKDIWFNSPYLKKIRTWHVRDRKDCLTCNVFEFCDFCPGAAYTETGCALKAYPSACRNARLVKRAYELAREFRKSNKTKGR